MSKHGYTTSKAVEKGTFTQNSAKDAISVTAKHIVTGADKTSDVYIADPYDVTKTPGDYDVNIMITGVTGGPVKQKVHVLDKDNLVVGNSYAVASNDISYEQGVITGKTPAQIMADAAVKGYDRRTGAESATQMVGEKPVDVANKIPYTVKFEAKNDQTTLVPTKVTINPKSTNKPVVETTDRKSVV